MRQFLSAAALIAAAFSAPFVVLGAPLAAVSVVQPADDKPLAQDPRLIIGQLENGFRYVISQHANPPQRALVWMQVSTGTLNETDKQRGAARMVQHLAFAGSKNFPGETVLPYLEELGNQKNADVLSHCTFEETVFKLALKQANMESLGKALDFLAEIPTNLSMTDQAVEAERAKLIEQTKLPSTTDQRIQDIIWSKLAPGTIFGQRLPTASEAAYRAISAADCTDYYKKWYVPSNMTLMVVGDLTQQEVETMVKARFGALPKAPRPAPQDIAVKPYDKSFAIIATDPELDQVQLYGFKLQPSHPPTKTESQLRAKLVESLAIASFNRRLNDKVASGKVDFVSGSAFAIDLANVATLIGINAGCDPKDWQKTMISLSTEAQRTRLHGLLASDIEDVKKQYSQAAEQGAKMEATRTIGTMMAGFAGSVNNQDAILSAEQTAEALARLLPTITKAELDARFSAMFDPAAVAFVVAAPTGDSSPKEAEVMSVGTQAFSAKPAPETEVVKPTTLMTELPKAGKVVSTAEHAKSGVQTWTLDNGAIVHYLNSSAKKDMVNVTIAFAGGILQETADNHGITEAASLAWSRPATTKLSSANIRELLQGKDVEIGGNAGVDNILFGISGKPSGIESGMQAAYLAITDPFIEPPTFDQWRRSNLDGAENRSKKPENVFNDSLLAIMFPEGEFRLRTLQKSEITKVTPDAATKWLNNIVANNPIEVSIVGDIGREEAERLALLYVGSLPKRPSPTSATFADLRVIKQPAGGRATDREIAELAQAAYLLVGFYGADENNAKDRRALFIARSIIEPRLTRLLREQEQIAYGVQVQFDSGQEFPGFGLFRAMAPTVPDKVDAAAKKIQDTFTSMAEVGPTNEELEAVRKEALKALDDAQKDPNYWTGELSLLSLRGKSLDDISGERAAYESITVADIRETFAKYYKKDSLLQLIMRPGSASALPPAPGK